MTTAPADFPGGRAGQELTVDSTAMGIPCLGLNGGEESACGWRRDKWGLSWQITPRVLSKALSNTAKATRARHCKAEDAQRHKDMGFEQGWSACADKL